MIRKIAAVVALSGMLSEEAAFGRQAPAQLPRQAEVSWDELAGFVIDKRVSTVLPDGAKLEGEVLAVRPEALVLDVQKSSRKKVYPLGQIEIPRPDVREVCIIRHQWAVFRVLGGVMGGLGGAFAAGWIAYVTDSAAAVVPALLLLIPLSAAGGYYAGKLADRRTTRIRIRPEPVTTGMEEQ